jgi:disulfide bond formation protein DsbB
VVAGAVLTVVYHVAACPLCIVQRMLFLAIAVASLFGLACTRPAIHIGAALLAAAFAASGAAIAGYQIYLQRNPFAATCGDGTAWWERLVEQAGQLLPWLFKADGLCADTASPLLGLSIVEWSLLAFSGLFLGGLLTLFSRASR